MPEARLPMIGISVEREPVEVIGLVRVEDQDWRVVDAKGHGHFWKGKHLPTLRKVKVGEEYVGDEFDGDVYPVHEWQCRLCGEAVKPGYKERPAEPIFGPTWVTVSINGSDYVMTVEQYAETVDRWEDIISDVVPAQPRDIEFGKDGRRILGRG